MTYQTRRISALAPAVSCVLESLEGRRLLAAAHLPDWLGNAVKNSEPVRAALLRSADLSTYSEQKLSAANQWLVGANTARVVNDLAAQFGAATKIVSTSSLIKNTYVLTLPAGVGDAHRALDAIDSVDYFAPMFEKQQTPRLIPNDPNFPNQWHLRNTGQGGGLVGNDANVTGVWDNYRGAGVTVASVDDGLTVTHEDLAPNYVPQYSFDFNSNEPNPSPGSHGTSVGGVMAARGNNGIGVSGAAPEASLAGIRLIAGTVTDQIEANALSYFKNNIDIYNNSWGPNDGGTTLEAPGPLTLAAFADVTTNGRNGLGGIYAWAGGNGGDGDNVNFDGYANSRYVIAVGAMGNNGVRSSYSERGASVLVSAMSTGGSLGITTVSSGGYTNGFGGTSSASPLAAGVIALMLDANPTLTWRDVQHILVRSAKKVDAAEPGWSLNGAGHDINDKYGYGAIDAGAAVALAESWTTVAPEQSATSGVQAVGAAIPDGNAVGISRSVNISDPLKVESVEVIFNATHLSRGQLRVRLTSPSGTVSELATGRTDSGDNFSNWLFTSKRNWDENAAGTWTLTVIDPTGGTAGTWNDWKLNVYGTLQGKGIYGAAFNDLDADGTRDAGENGLANVLVYLDKNINGTFDGDDVSFTSNAQGNYAFNDLLDGTYVVRANTPVGVRPAGPTSHTITISNGTPVATNQNFAFVNPRIAGVVYDDANDSGLRDVDETGRSGLTVFIDADESGTLNSGDPTDLTDSNGAYSFDGLADGDYRVRLVAPAGNRVTQGPGGYNATISSSSLVALARDFGLTTKARIVGTVYDDANGNGTQDLGEGGLSGRTVFIDADNDGQFSNFNGSFNSTAPATIPTLGVVSSNIVVTNGPANISKLTVRLNITHSFDSDIAAALFSPNGTRVQLFSGVGGSGDNFTNTIFDDAAATAIASGIAPFTGTFRPAQALAAFNGQNGNGTWRLEITDSVSGLGGTLNNWTLNFAGAEKSAVTAADGSYAFPALDAGNYPVRLVPAGAGTVTSPAAGFHNVVVGAGDLVTGNFGVSSFFASTSGLYVRLNQAGTNIEIFRNETGAGTPDLIAPLVTTPSLNLQGGPSDDRLIIDLVNGNPVPTGGLSYHGDAQIDSVVVKGSANADTVRYDVDKILINGRQVSLAFHESVRFEGNAGDDVLEVKSTNYVPEFDLGTGRNLLRVIGPNSFTIDRDVAAPDSILDAEVVAENAQLVFDSSQHLGTLTLFPHTFALLVPAPEPEADVRTLRVTGLSIDPTAALFLERGALIIDYRNNSPIQTVQALLTSGYANGEWNGKGIASAFAGDSAISDGLGYAEASDLFGANLPTTYLGEPVDATTLIVRYTLAGDANLDGGVNIGDFSLLASHFNTDGKWFDGNFNYDSAVNIGDFALLAANFNTTAPARSSTSAFNAPQNPFGMKRIDERSLVSEVL